MKSLILSLIVLLSTVQVMACSCACTGDCSFSVVSKNADFVALIKVISYDDYLENEIYGHEGKMPHSMTVEIIKKYKGKETRQRIKIWGDGGADCRPYLSNFKIGEYYLIAPNKLQEYIVDGETFTDYDFFTCNTDYLKVDMDKQQAFGKYSKRRSKIGLSKFEKKLNK